MNYLSNETDSLINNEIHLQTAPSPSTEQNPETRTGTGILGTIFLIVNATLGAGLLNFPQAFDNAGGLVSSIVMQLCFLIFITAALVVLAYSSDITDTSSLQDTFAGLCGHKSQMLCAVCVAIYSFGCTLTFLIIIGDQFDRVFATFYGPDFCHHWYLSRTFITSVTAVAFILPLCFFKTLGVLSYTSSIGCITILYVIFVVIYESFVENLPNVKPMKIWPDNAYEALQIVPIICFAYQSHMTAIPTYACMKHRHLGKFTLSVIISMIICFVAYTVVGIFGYATFGSGKVPSDILQGYTDKTVTLTVAIISIAVKNFTTYPIVLYCGRDAFLSLFGMTVDDSIIFRVILTLSWFVMSLVIAICVPDIAPIINLLGVLSATFIFIFPGICLLQSILSKDPELYLNKDRLMTFLAVLIIALGAFVCGIVFVEALEDLKKTPSDEPLVTGFRIQLKASLCN